jgi:DNA-3-methyladenine glycosylase II
MWEHTLKVEPPYDFTHILKRLSHDPLNKVDIEQQLIRVPIYKTKTVATVQSVGDVGSPKFIVSSDHEDAKDETIDEIRKIFLFDRSLKPIYDHFQKTNLSELFKTFKGMPIVSDFSVYACLMRSIIHQQLNLSFAHTLTARFVHTYGYEIDGVWFYPDPTDVANLPYEALRELQFSQRKAEYVIDTSKLIASGELRIDDLEDLADDKIIERLVKIRGVGPWTVEILLLFGLGRPNLFPKKDIGIQNAIKKQFQLESKPSFNEMDEYSREWSPYLSYASLYLWKSIET